MLSKRDMGEYILANVKDFLSEKFQDATVDLVNVIKTNDIELTGIVIRKSGQNIAPTVYLEEMYEKYIQSIWTPDDVVRNIANMREQYDCQENMHDIIELTQSYQSVKDKLQIRICDKKGNQKRLAGLAYTELWNSSMVATYHVILDASVGVQASFAITAELLNIWGVSLERLHEDALQSPPMQNPVLVDVVTLLSEALADEEAANLLLEQDIVLEDIRMLYVLTNQWKTHGASFILQKDLMRRVSEMFGNIDFYILPSSVNEVILLPYSDDVNLEELKDMVQTININEVQPSEVLTDTVMLYEREHGEIRVL